jgi:hypothetical protein
MTEHLCQFIGSAKTIRTVVVGTCVSGGFSCAMVDGGTCPKWQLFQFFVLSSKYEGRPSFVPAKAHAKKQNQESKVDLSEGKDTPSWKS